jgi:tetratricopeptide (TPR) repeat protein
MAWFSAYCGLTTGCGGEGEILHLEDLNADGLPEWVVAVGSYCGYGECGGHLLIMGWRDGEIVELVQRDHSFDLSWTGVSGGGGSPLVPPEGTWTFRNIDNDEALELIQRRYSNDNRDCWTTDERIFDWIGIADAYVRIQATLEFDDSAACALRQAHEAMKIDENDAAISFYDHALELLPIDGTDYEREARQYVQIRLMIAYSLEGREEEAVALLQELQMQTPASSIMDDLIQALVRSWYLVDRNPVALCSEVYLAVRQFDIYSDDTDFWTFGQTDSVPFRPQTYVGGDFSAANSGCNLPGLLNDLIANHRFTTDSQPATQMAGLGWPIEAQYNTDLNGDGSD